MKQIEDTRPFIHASEETHSACPEMVEKLGDKVGCCDCNNHKCKQTEEQVCICLDCGKGRCHPMCKVCTPLLDTEAKKTNFEQYIEDKLDKNPELRKKVEQAEAELDTEAWEKGFDEKFTETTLGQLGNTMFNVQIMKPVENTEIKDFIHTLLKNKAAPGIKDNSQNTGIPGKSEDWEKSFDEKFGIVHMDNGQNLVAVGSENSDEFKDFIRTLLKNKEVASQPTQAWEEDIKRKYVKKDDKGVFIGNLLIEDINKLLKNKESSTLQAVKEKVEKSRVLPELCKSKDKGIGYNSALDDVLRLIEEI